MSRLTDPHDGVHPNDGDPAWFEAFWFGLSVPEIDLVIYIYPWFRTVLGNWGGGVLAWDGQGALPWTMFHNDYRWSEPLRDPATMIDGDRIETPHGVTIECLKPGADYHVTYEHPALAVDVTFAAVATYNLMERATANAELFGGHIDQPGHVTGHVRVGEKTHPVDCHWVRDRSWGPRRNDNIGMHIGYYHATASASDAFLIVTDSSNNADRSTLITGYLIRDGVSSKLVDGTASLTRDTDLSPATAQINATDALGRQLQAIGVSRTRLAYQIQPGMFNWSTLARWEFGDAVADGELQDTWHPDTYRSFARGEL